MKRLQAFRKKLSIATLITLTIMGIVLLVVLANIIIYPNIFRREANTLIESQSREINKQILFTYEQYIQNVIEAANFLQQQTGEMDVGEEYDMLQQSFHLNSLIREDIIGITLFSIQGYPILGGETVLSYTHSATREEWFIEALTEEDLFYFSAPHRRSVYLTNQKEVISVSKLISYNEEGVTKRGVLLIELNFAEISRLAQLTNLGDGGHLLIVNDGDTLIYNSAPDLPASIGQAYPFVVENFFGLHHLKIEGIAMIIQINTLSNTRWRIVTVSNVNNIAIATRAFWRIMGISIIGIIIGTIIISISVASRITRPLKELRKSMFRVEQGHFQTKLHISGQKELMVVAHAFNTMAEEIETLMDRVVEEQREKRKTALQIFQNQITPHFLYNTLDSIVWLAEQGRTEDVITTVTALARFFRISVSRGKTIISVEDEIAHIASYLIIQKIRYGDRFTYRLDCNPEVYTYSTMKLLLQPLVENAIEHGLHDDPEEISIRGYKEGEFLLFEVTNTGYGIADKQIADIYKTMHNAEPGGVGMRNVYRRIKLYYGDEADLTIFSTPDSHTTVTLKIPAIPREAPHED